MLEGKRLIITGAGSGIGRATSRLAGSYGASVLCVDLAESVADTASAIRDAGGNAISTTADVADEAEVEGFVDKCVGELGGVDGIYANAGVPGGGKPMLELTVEDWQRTLAVNTIGVFLAIKHTVPRFIEQGAGAIVATASRRSFRDARQM